MGAGFGPPLMGLRRMMDEINEGLEKNRKTEQQNSKLEDAVYLSWEESERNWGVRPDGFSLHLTEEDCKSYVRKYWSEMPNEVPDEYSRPAGRSAKVKVSKELYRRIGKGKSGIRYFSSSDEGHLVENGHLVFNSQRTGWIPVDIIGNP